MLPQIPIRALSLAVALAVLVYMGMATMADWSAFGDAVSATPALMWFQVIALSLVSYLARFMRWHRFLLALGHPVPVWRDLEIYLSGFALTLTPGKAGETVRSVYLQPYGVRYTESIGVFIAERLLDLIIVGLLASLAAFIFPEHRSWALGAVAFFFLMTLMLRSRIMAFLAERLARHSLGKHTARGIDTVRFVLSGRRLAGALPLSLLAWSAQGFSLYLVVRALGYDIPATDVMSIYCLSILAGVASMIPGGLGATEAAIALLLNAVGMSQGDAITASLISRGLTLWLAVGIGIAAMSRIAMSAQLQRNASRL